MGNYNYRCFRCIPTWKKKENIFDKTLIEIGTYKDKTKKIKDLK